MSGTPADRTGPQGQLRLSGMPTPLYPCTPTRLTTWLDCPRRYRFAYLDRPQPAKGPPWAHYSLGAAVHVALADWWALPTGERTPQAGSGVLVRRWRHDGFRDAAQSADALERAGGWVRDYLERIDPRADPVGVERTVATRTPTLALSGRIDRLDRRGERLVVVDYKTGRYVPGASDARTSLALALYAVAAGRTLRAPCSRVELHHLPSGTVAAAEHDEEGLARKLDEAASIAADAARADAAFRDGKTGDDAFPPRPSPGCSWCDWRQHCPQGRAAAPDVEPWAALP